MGPPYDILGPKVCAATNMTGEVLISGINLVCWGNILTLLVNRDELVGIPDGKLIGDISSIFLLLSTAYHTGVDQD